ncbi:MAG: hypothetical protein AB1Z23_00415 [Eubacteriales bacterium]
MSKLFDTKKEAIADFAKYAILLTDIKNREHAAVLREKDGKFFYTKIEKGFHSTVWPTAIKNMLLSGTKYFLHTHPNHGTKTPKGNNKDNIPFSGVPGSKKAKDAGDAMVVDVLGYDGIYLVSAMGNVYLYEGMGKTDENDNTHADTEKELENLKPIFTGMTQSKYCYKKVERKKKRAQKYEVQSWNP